jgi:hypothetical protein
LHMGSFSFSSSQKRGLKGKQNQTMKITLKTKEVVTSLLVVLFVVFY